MLRAIINTVKLNSKASRETWSVGSRGGHDRDGETVESGNGVDDCGCEGDEPFAPVWPVEWVLREPTGRYQLHYR